MQLPPIASPDRSTVLAGLALMVGIVGCEPDGQKDTLDDAGEAGGTDWDLYTDTGDTGTEQESMPEDSGTPIDEADPYGRDPSCPQPTECISLAESVDRGWSDISFNGTLDVKNSGPYEICSGRWHTFFSDYSQDAIAGDSSTSRPGVPEDALLLEAGASRAHNYAESANGPAWWCIERTQVTAYNSPYRFTGARAPDPILSWVDTATDTNTNGVQDQVDYADPSTGAPWTNHNIWDHIAEQPVYVVGRDPNYIEIRPGTSVPLTIEVVNLGREASSIQVSERLPAGARAWGFSVTPSTIEENGDGSTTHTWYFKMNGSTDDENVSQPTDYDIVRIDYNVEWTSPDCGYREKTWAPEVSWLDLSGVRQVSYGTELVIACCEGG